MPIPGPGGAAAVGAGPNYATTSDPRWGARGIVKFGNAAIPVIGGTLPYIDLNDGVNWFCQDVVIQRDNHELQQAQQAWWSKAAWLGEDFTMAKIAISELYDENGGGAGFTAAIAQLLASGEQYLTFDNTTGILCKCKSAGAAKRTVTASPFLYSTTLEFWAKEPWFKGLTQTTNNGTAVAGSSGAGTTTNITQTYNGTWWGEPTYVLHIPNTNTATISSLKINNTTSGQGLTAVFSPVLTASAVHTVTVDCIGQHVTDENATEYDISGSFPMLYGQPQGGSVNNALQVTIASSAGTTGLTLDVDFYNRYVS